MSPIFGKSWHRVTELFKVKIPVWLLGCSGWLLGMQKHSWTTIKPICIHLISCEDADAAIDPPADSSFIHSADWPRSPWRRDPGVRPVRCERAHLCFNTVIQPELISRFCWFTSVMLKLLEVTDTLRMFE